MRKIIRRRREKEKDWEGKRGELIVKRKLERRGRLIIKIKLGGRD